METFVTIVHIATCILLVLVVLLQSGKGAEISASFGGSSQTVFGSSGGANFFTRFTAALAFVFMVTSITLTVMSAREQRGIFDGAPLTETAPSVEAKSTAPEPPTNTQLVPEKETAPKNGKEK